MFKINELLIILLVVVGWFGLVGFQVVWAEPQFGGVVEELVVCTCTHNEFLRVSDPHGGDNGTEGKYIINSSTTKEDCEPLQQGEYILGMHTENSETCRIRVNNVCVVYDSGLVIDHYGSSPNNCGSHKTTASSSVVDDIKQRRDNGEEVVGSGTTNSSEKTNKSGDVVNTIKQKRDNGEEVKSSDDINNSQATHNSEDVIRDIVQRRDNREEVRGSESGGVLSNMGINVDPDGGVRVLGDSNEKVNKKTLVGDREKRLESNRKTISQDVVNKNDGLWKLVLAGLSFMMGGFFVWRAGMKMFG